MAAVIDYVETSTINDRLPVAVTLEDLARNPEFGKLLETMTKFMSANGTSASTEQDLSEAKQRMLQQKRKWLHSQVLYAETQELILDHHLQSAQVTSSVNAQFYKMVEDMLAQAQIGEYLGCSPDPSCCDSLLGLTVDKLDQISSHKMNKQSMLQKLIPDVESRLRRRCESLVSFHDKTPVISIGDSRFDFAKAAQLPAIIADEHQKLKDEKELLTKDVIERRRLNSHYKQLLVESFDLLNRLLIDHRLKSQSESDTVATEWLAARCDALCLKLKVLELQLLYDTYHIEAVRALSVVKSEVDSSLAETEAELNRTATAVRTYESVGTEFDSIVDEFTRLRAEVDNRRWALHELKKHAAGADNLTNTSLII